MSTPDPDPPCENCAAYQDAQNSIATERDNTYSHEEYLRLGRELFNVTSMYLGHVQQHLADIDLASPPQESR